MGRNNNRAFLTLDGRNNKVYTARKIVIGDEVSTKKVHWK